MAASAADVRSILSLPASSTAGPSQSQAKKPAGPSTRKPEGISRELFALIGPSAPSIAAQLAKPRLKQKPNLGGGGKVKWWADEIQRSSGTVKLIIYFREWRSFKNSARSDQLEIGHWVKASTDPSAGMHWAIFRLRLSHTVDEDSSFTKYNVQPTTYTYSQDEYARFLEGISLNADVSKTLKWNLNQTWSGQKKKPIIYSNLLENTIRDGTSFMIVTAIQMVCRVL